MRLACIESLPMSQKKDPYGLQSSLVVEGKSYNYISLARLAKQRATLLTLPYSIRILLENVLNHLDGFAVLESHVEDILDWKHQQRQATIPFCPSRVLMQDFTGVPAIVDLASIRDQVKREGGNPQAIHPLVPVDLVIDHSVQVEYYGSATAYERNVEREYEKNKERYALLKWAQQAFDNFRVVPPGMGICHQVNIEYLAEVVIDRAGQLFPDTLVGTDSHTPMVNALGVLGWGVGGIEAEAAMLGQPLYMQLPEVIGLRLIGALREGTTATDLVLHITERLRRRGVVGCFVEAFGEGVAHLAVTDRATISNMSPEFGCTDTHWPIDEATLVYLRNTGRGSAAKRVERYAKENLLWHDPQEELAYSDVVTVDLDEVESTISGPKRPQDKILLREAKAKVFDLLADSYGRDSAAQNKGLKRTKIQENGHSYPLGDASVVIAAITSCTNTSNPNVMIAAGLLAQKAVERGLQACPWVKTSLAPGSRVVTRYLEKAGLLSSLEALNFYVVGYGCTTCIGNSGDLPPPIQQAIDDEALVVAAVLSGNRNFEARIHPQIQMNFLASPPLVVAYALAGRMDVDLKNEALGKDKNGKEVFLRDLWPSQEEIQDCLSRVLSAQDYEKTYATIFSGDHAWQSLVTPSGNLYAWDPNSTYIREAPFFQPTAAATVSQDIRGARPLLLLGDMVTTDHISPAGKFTTAQPAGQYLEAAGVSTPNFNSYGARRGNHEVMIRGTFANVRIRNHIVDQEGGYTRHFPSGEPCTIFDAAQRYAKEGVPLVVFAGKEYGSGSSRDWAAKGTALLGVQAVIAESFERIHRSNLVGMGVLPIEMIDTGMDELGLSGPEQIDVLGLESLRPAAEVEIRIHAPDQATRVLCGKLRLDSAIDIAYYREGGILQHVMRKFLHAPPHTTKP